ncbi:penicillin-binding protein 1C [Undibacterium fentianense]|uniref:peptidoglycan glycosyltransferase n=1 Tax=Undibacterium fentianense TaxID=2828728 RepID=A0A941E3B8_9BURK|nr:penicillin-binding protein 1C [Undibacterium fentianense]MBR7801580.1 penicillin-binding protein 1C [Undibacterium fentianense]
MSAFHHTSRILKHCRNWVSTHRWRAFCAAALSLLLLLDQVFPPPIPDDEPGLVVVARDGTPLRAWPDADGVWRFPVTPDKVSKNYIDALLTYEDRWFYWHPGVNPLALSRAAWQWLTNGEIVSGGSTLSMQVARAIEPVPRSVSGKLRQIARALQLELRLSKNEILTLYLNHAPMGGIVEGVEMASRSYLGKSAIQLSAAEAALLVVLPQAPSRLRPDRHPLKAQQYRDKVLHRMAQLKHWTQAEVEDALIEKVGANPPRLAWLAPLAAERLRQVAQRQSKINRKKTRGSVDLRATIVQSTLDREIQTILERMLADKVDQLPRFVSMAALVIDSKNLEILGYAGSADFHDERRFSHVDMVRGIRSPGSTLKPFLYAMALDDGLIHSESLLADTPQSFSGYDPGNFQASFSGPVSVSEALQRSLNVPAVDVLDRIGSSRFTARLSSAGLRLRLPKEATPNLSVILGGAGTSLEELVGAYRSLAMQGMAGTPRITPNAPMHEARMMSAGAAFIIRSILEGGGHPDQPFVENDGSGVRLAWKTGTSYGFRDAWAVGVSGRYTLGVWVGRPDGTPNPGFFGANVAAPLLQQIAYALPRSTPISQKVPDEVSTAQICWPLGVAAEQTSAKHCHVKRSAWILNHTIPPTLPDRLRARSLVETVWLDTVTKTRTTLDCNPNAQQIEVARWPSLLEAWLPPERKLEWGLVNWGAHCTGLNVVGSIKLMGLNSGSRLRAAPGRSDIPVTLDAVGGSGQHYWLLDGQQRSSGLKKRETFVLNTAGEHSITVIDAAGHVASVQFSVDKR